MRISVLRSDAGYSPAHCLYEVYIDGEYLPYVVTADEEKGYADVFELDDYGNPMYTELKDPVMVRVEGKVEIRQISIGEQ